MPLPTCNGQHKGDPVVAPVIAKLFDEDDPQYRHCCFKVDLAARVVVGVSIFVGIVAITMAILHAEDFESSYSLSFTIIRICSFAPMLIAAALLFLGLAYVRPFLLIPFMASLSLSIFLNGIAIVMAVVTLRELNVTDERSSLTARQRREDVASLQNVYKTFIVLISLVIAMQLWIYYICFRAYKYLCDKAGYNDVEFF